MKTAVEWLINELFNESTVVVTKENNPALFEVIEQAKAMEKEQIEEAYLNGFVERQFSIDCKAEQYYNETYKNTNE